MAARGPHDLADEKLEDAFVAGFELGDVVGIFFDDFADGLFNGRAIADLGKPFCGDNFGGAATSFKHGGENFFGDGARDLAGFDKF